MSMINWLPLESNPEVMNKCLKNFGVSEALGIFDILSMDPDFIHMATTNCYGVLLLFPVSEKYEQYCEAAEDLIKGQDECPGVYFMKQTIRNACGTIALIHTLANNEECLDLEPGSVLKKFLESTRGLSPDEKGKVLEENMEISAVHDEVAQEGQTEAPGLDDDVNLHFIALVRVGTKLVELDGRKSGPLIHGDTDEASFIQDACHVCQQYMKRDPGNLRFNAMAFGTVLS